MRCLPHQSPPWDPSISLWTPDFLTGLGRQFTGFGTGRLEKNSRFSVILTGLRVKVPQIYPSPLPPSSAGMVFLLVLVLVLVLVIPPPQTSGHEARFKVSSTTLIS